MVQWRCLFIVYDEVQCYLHSTSTRFMSGDVCADNLDIQVVIVYKWCCLYEELGEASCSIPVLLRHSIGENYNSSRRCMTTVISQHEFVEGLNSIYNLVLGRNSLSGEVCRDLYTVVSELTKLFRTCWSTVKDVQGVRVRSVLQAVASLGLNW